MHFITALGMLSLTLIAFASMSVVVGGRSRITPLYRYFNHHIRDHFYTANYAELRKGNHGWAFERIQCQLYPSQESGTQPLYRYWLPSREHFYTRNANEIGTTQPGVTGKYGYKSEGIAGYCFPKQRPGTVPLHRYYLGGWSQDHFYTTHCNEIGTTVRGRRGKYGYVYEGVACYVFPAYLGERIKTC